MATSKTYMPRSKNHRFLVPTTNPQTLNKNDPALMFELDESEVWNTSASSARSQSPNFRKPSSRVSRKTESGSGVRSVCGSSLPVNVPDWSKILKNEYRENLRKDYSDEGYDYDDVESDHWIPPHEYLARSRMASFSVHEGIGRTLKGRDLSRVRNAIWLKTGFQD